MLGGLWKIIAVLGAALFLEWLLHRGLRGPRERVEQRAASRQNAIDRKKEKASLGAAPAIMPSAATPAAPPAPSASHHWSLLRRFPFALAHWVLELISLAAFMATAMLLLNIFGGRPAVFHDMTLAIVEAYVTTRLVLSVVHLMASPLGQKLRLMHISDAAAAYVNRWLRRIIIVAVFGTAVAELALHTGGTRDTHIALSKLVGLAVHIMLLAMVLRSRKATAEAIRGTAGDNWSGLFGLREILADSWPFVATFLIVAAWLLWSAGAENGFQRVLYFFALSATVIVGASLVSIFVLGAIDRAFLADRENAPEHRAPTATGYEEVDEEEVATKGTYHLLIYRVVSILIGTGAFIVLLQVWGVDTLSWFERGSVGRRVASAAATIAITLALAASAWEALNVVISRRIDRWTDVGDTARAARLRTLLPMLRTTLLIIIGMIVLLAALHELGITIAPLLAGASIIGVALGFGSQKLVQDFITGIFLLMENAIQVGDFITVAGVSGVVEHLSIRTVRLRASDGSLHVVPFSSVSTVTNAFGSVSAASSSHRGIGNAAIRVSVTADSDVDRVLAAIRSVCKEMRSNPQLNHLILADPEIWGVDHVDGSIITILGQMQTLDKGRWAVQRSFNRRILERFRESGIQFSDPQQTRVVTQAPIPVMPIAPVPGASPKTE